MKKCWKMVKEFLFFFWFVWVICSPLFVLKAILVLSTRLAGWAAFAVATGIWAFIFVAGAFLLVKPWRKKKTQRGLA